MAAIPVHRNTDDRKCGATTIVSGQSTVFVNNLLISVNGDENTHGGGAISAACNNVFVENKLVARVGNDASQDALCPVVGGDHCNPSVTSGSSNVFVGD